MKYRKDFQMTQGIALHAVNILTSDIDKSISFYCQHLKMQISARHCVEGHYDFALLQDSASSTNIFINLHGPPYTSWMDSFITDHGPMISHLSFHVDDLDGWVNKFRKSEIEILGMPENFLSKRHMFIRDPTGVVLEFMTLPPSLSSPPKLSRKVYEQGVSYRLSHTNITCQDIPALEEFYVEELGMKVVHDAKEDGMVFLADPAALADEDHDVFPLELFGPPGLWETDLAFLEKHGAGLQYLCFAVVDVDKAYQELLSKGVDFHLQPTEFEANRVAFFKDPNGIDIEILHPLPQALLRG